MVVDRAAGSLQHARFRDLPRFLRPGDLLIHNESRVFPARLFARKPTGGKVEVLLLRADSEVRWEALVRGRSVRVGTRLEVLDGPDGEPVGAAAQVLQEGERGWRLLDFDRPALELAWEVGQTPLPPYIREPLRDPERYQTVYARQPGSAAAPTAGLHFTPALLSNLQAHGVQSLFVVLHVGLDTFRPVTEETVERHRLHSEYGLLPPQVAAQVNLAKREGRRVLAVGTTSVRLLESAARSGSGDSHQRWVVQPFEGLTDLFIYPGYKFRVVDGLITNFHLPRSTLLMLVAAFCGKELLDRAYREAMRLRYRFYSFGDAMLVL